MAIFTSQVDNAITLSAGAFDASASTGGGTVNGGSERVALLLKFSDQGSGDVGRVWRQNSAAYDISTREDSCSKGS